MASYINRYHRGRMGIGWEGDFLKVKWLRKELSALRRVLPPAYFEANNR